MKHKRQVFFNLSSPIYEGKALTFLTQKNTAAALLGTCSGIFLLFYHYFFKFVFIFCKQVHSSAARFSADGCWYLYQYKQLRYPLHLPVSHLLRSQIIRECGMVCAAGENPRFSTCDQVWLWCPECSSNRKFRHRFLCLFAVYIVDNQTKAVASRSGKLRLPDLSLQ